MLADDLERLTELPHDHVLGLDPVTQLQAGVVHGNRRGRRRAVMRGQHRREHRGPDRVTAAGHLERELRGQLPDAGRAGALPLRPHQAQRHAPTIVAVRRPAPIHRIGHADLRSRATPNHGTLAKVRSRRM
jgi:hypothetical protein